MSEKPWIERPPWEQNAAIARAVGKFLSALREGELYTITYGGRMYQIRLEESRKAPDEYFMVYRGGSVVRHWDFLDLPEKEVNNEQR